MRPRIWSVVAVNSPEHAGNRIHPAVWPAIANRVFAEELVRGSWIHTRSIVRHHDVGPVGATPEHEAIIDLGV